MGGKRERPLLPDGIEVRSARSIQISFEFRGVRCRETVKLAPTPANIKRVALHRAAIVHAIAVGTFDYGITFPDSPRAAQFSQYQGTGYLLRDYLPRWLETRKKSYKASTVADYKRTINNVLIPEIGHLRLADLKISHIRELCEKQTCSLKTVINRLMTLRTALQDAVNDELIETNIIREWRYERVEPPREADDVDPFTPTEREAILKSCKHDQLRNLFEFAFWSGLRTSELVALEWGDIDWIGKKARIARAKTRAAKVAEAPKTRKSAREISLLAPALKALERQKQWTFMSKGRVFHNPIKNTPWPNDQKIRLAWVDALLKAGVRYRRPYQTRHTFASTMLSAGENPQWVADMLGHSGLAMISKTYGRFIQSDGPAAGGKAVSLFGKVVA